MGKIVKALDLSAKDVGRYEYALLIEEEEVRDPLDIMAEARAEAEAKVKEAYEEGLRRGYTAGEQQFREEVNQAAAVLDNAAKAMQDAHGQYLDAMTPQVVALTNAIAKRILGREAQLDEAVVLKCARDAIGKLLEREELVLRVNPADLETLRDKKAAFLEEFDGVRTVEVVPDETVTSGGCVAESRTMEADGQLETQLSEILKTLME